ncbi:pyridoxal-phosphate dependent enzyme [Pseudomonas purpurea]|uniref:pyridoxal-phosphate dependent enzyme n=1 Tax=Pseudomonas purpurea TaxID=3136737 RepID=UPI0032677E69
MITHIADAMKVPSIIRLDNNLFCLRFETMKIYSALAAVEHLLATGVVKKGDTLLDSSSGIYAYALALACNKYEMKCHIIASKTVDKTLMTQLNIMGVHVEQVPPSATLKMDQSYRVNRIQEIVRDNPGVHWMQQYHDDIHYLGYAAVARQIEQDLGAANLTIVGGVGSGCSTGGLVKPLRDIDPSVKLIGVQPFGSVTFNSDHIEDPGIVIAGIGSGIPFRNVDHTLYDEIQWISFDHGLSGSVDLLRQHAVFAGLSTGCNYLAARREAAMAADRNILFVAADTGHRYIDGVFAHHPDARRADELQPTVIEHIDQLQLPWAVMNWNRREFNVAEGTV